MKITQFGLRYSPNLGDGVIAECVAHGVRTRKPGVDLTHVDLSGRGDFGAVTVRNREMLLAILDRLPLWLRQRLTLWKLGKLMDRLEADWRAAAQCDLAVIGGGQILSDANLNFPIKVGQAARLLREAATPTAIYAVGVSKNWTPKGQALFARLLETDLRMVGPRDAHSLTAWTDQTEGGPTPEVLLDPGLLAAECYGPAKAVSGRIGLCVTDFNLLGHHADGSVAGGAVGPVEFYVGIAEALITKGFDVCLFTNGAAEDRALRARVAAALGQRDGVLVPEDPVRPDDLVSQIGACEAVVAHRLHACIVAYSYGRAIVGLGWDRKLQSFFETVDLAAGFTAAPEITGTDVARLVDTALARGVDASKRAQILDRAWAGIDRLLDCATPPTEG
ncbi:hypothetical protein JANAI62_24600 [Jannaschia pagri]|uniref:Polysaccharide pyruvyl transferase domain-containing protein n=1 Tax=Jannaschia pagri TaxID=2829797 RepID=A0ABQ4NN47_9RHOB|nr:MULTISPECIES: polysaccharide pyruvyl transferase family protein [unclassified Jannaschia]GIT92003.1 hypothetical protein JANAI61_24610 [Jannaschia sp. AI_61]GIT95837.1 hypothetical protein JANAI62_24600 [Jannaschia sp. AI_62]